MADDNANDVQDADDFTADEKQDSPKDPSPKEAKADAKAEVKAEEKPEVAKVTDKVEAKAETEPEKLADTDKGKEDVADDTAETDKTPEETEVKPLGEEKPLAPKSENRFQKLANDNKALREQVEKLTSNAYEPQTAEQLSDIVNPETGEYYTAAQAADVAMEQQLQMRDYNDQITRAQSTISGEAYEVLQEFPMFNPKSEEFDEELAGIAAETLQANLIRDPNIPEVGPDGKPTGQGMIVDYRQSPKQIYKTLARASGISTAKGQIKGQQATEQMLANADTNTSTAPEKKPADPLAAIWEEPL